MCSVILYWNATELFHSLPLILTSLNKDFRCFYKGIATDTPVLRVEELFIKLDPAYLFALGCLVFLEEFFI